MKHVSLCAGVAAMLAVAACSSATSTEYTSYDLNRRFAAHPANEFFHMYGFPDARFEKTKGSAVYRWASTNLRVFPATAAPVTYYSEHGNYQVVDEGVRKEDKQYCQLRIYVDEQDIIQRIDITVDTVGRMSNSRCSEIFE